MQNLVLVKIIVAHPFILHLLGSPGFPFAEIPFKELCMVLRLPLRDQCVPFYGYFSKWEAWRSLLRSSSCCSSNSGTAAVATRALSEALWLCEERSWGRRRGASQAWLRRRLHQPPCPKAAGGLRTLPPSQLPRESCIYLFLCLHLYGITAILFKSL